ncbi:VOC family protein [Nonomuraea harbinensis]|uniref:VOC family protein n=1 Tax=Nonomuraea harbinensis TaxID=1286938 RepID=A0ABW1BT68_9ACTN|nr:VOC family protein [Nonomuraea harbinensis]
MAAGFLGVAHVGIVVDDLEEAVAATTPVAGGWSDILEWDTVVRFPDGSREQRPVRFVTAASGPAHVKMIESAEGSVWAPTGGVQQLHHLTYWVPDIEEATAGLLATGRYRVEADGLEPDDSVRFRYLLNDLGLRIELGLLANKPGFDSWAAGGEHA